jgi:hypothetical protein
MLSTTLPKRFLSKSKLSTYLRTQCDRHLYLSLFSNDADALEAAGVPIPLKTRPSVQLVTASGRAFEIEQFDILKNALPQNVILNANYSPIDLLVALTNPIRDTQFILQPEIEPENFRSTALTNLGLSHHEQSLIPPLSGLRPDVIIVRPASEDDYEILPDGSRRRINTSEIRLALCVVDLKNVTEANASYAAEVCLYAYFLVNWLHTIGASVKDRYYVADQIFLWKHIEMLNFRSALGASSSANPQARINALLEDLKEGLVDFLIYMPSVRKFFKEDLPRVITKGDTEGWDKVEYHVSSKCGACDWLGNRAWLWGDDLTYFDANPHHYCLVAADTSDHLSKLAGISKGASFILAQNGLPKVGDLVGIPFSTPVLKLHSFLKKEKMQIGERARALNTGTLSIDTSIQIGGLASKLNAEYDIIVNFDAGAGLLTGIAIRGVLFPPYGEVFKKDDGTTSNVISLGEEAFVVEKDFLNSEWVTLSNFINRLSNWATQTQQIFDKHGFGSVSTQICFWEPRQYEELSNAFGRHLLNVLQLSDRSARALAWIFPPEELLERQQELAPGIVFIKDVIEIATRLPIKFNNTLLGVAEVYHHPKLQPRNVDTYYREPLGNAIPRERIFEIWKCSTGVVRWYGRDISLSEAINKYGNVLKSHVWALSIITARLRNDLRSRLSGSAPVLNLSIPSGIAGVAYDSKLWVQWDRVEAGTAKIEEKANLIAKAERLEASYKAIVLKSLISILGNNRYEYEVSDESTEAKLEKGGKYYVVGIVNTPGFPLRTPASYGIISNPPSIPDHAVWQPFNQIIKVAIESFDRINRRVIIELRPSWSGTIGIFNEIMSQGIIPIGQEELYIMEGTPYDDTKLTETILRDIGDPTCARPAPEALRAMGSSARRRVAQGTDAPKPLARVLWEPQVLAQTRVRSAQESDAVLNYARAINTRGLNRSQEDAIKSCASQLLSVIWGPPGTGKTDTLASLLHSLVYENQTSSRSKKILISGPNYRAVEELALRLFATLNNDPNCVADFFLVYSRNREPKKLPAANTHLRALSFQLNPKALDANAIELLNSMNDASRTTIVATTAHVTNSIASIYGNTSAVQEIFDFIIIDESSQVPITLAIRPLALLKTNSQVVIAGDHMQMPPIASLEPPKNAEYLVGSIQTYLIKRFSIATNNLLLNYRSNQDLVDYSKTLGYPHNLQAHNRDRRIAIINDITAAINTLPVNMPVTDAYHHILAPDSKVIAFIHDDIVSSQANEVEAKLVASIAYLLRQSASQDLFPNASQNYRCFDDDSFFERGIGVVTPHKAQKALVVRELLKLFPSADPDLIYESVDTVERFQGGERDTILVSFGVGDVDIIEGEELFLLQMERTNVAVSRAKAKCVLIMPKALAYHIPNDEKASKTAVAIKSYIEEFCNNRISVDINFQGEIRKGEVRWH